ncbi:MAG: S1 RNA-binding domain-containing protein [Clostridiales bacterium]|nr:S1 RNA-binding domain-containing protein [Clostridiales bacterium]
MQLEIGNIYEGKVTEITKFGAFVEVEGKTGMVHISEISNTFVNEIKDHVQIGQTVKVKVIGITDEGKISMSMKKALPQEERPKRNFGGQQGFNRGNSNNNGRTNDGNRSFGGNRNNDGNRGNDGNRSGDGNRGFNGGNRFNSDRPRSSYQRNNSAPRDFASSPPPVFEGGRPCTATSKDGSFEDMLNKFKQSSEEKISDLKKINDNKRKTGARRK